MGRNNKKKGARRRNFVSLHALEANDDIDNLVNAGRQRRKNPRDSHVREQRLEAVAKELQALANSVTEIYVANLPSHINAFEVARGIHDALHIMQPDLVPRRDARFEPAADTSRGPSTSVVVRCEIRRHKIQGRPSSAFVSLVTRRLAETLTNLKYFTIPPYDNFIAKANFSKNPRIPGIGRAWQSRSDPGSMRWKIGNVQVGEKLSDSTFSSFWQSSPFFDLAENSYVELNPIRHMLSITLGRKHPVRVALPCEQRFEKRKSFFRIDIPFRSIRAGVQAERATMYDHNRAIYIPVTQSPFLLRTEQTDANNDVPPPLEMNEADTVWDYLVGSAPTIRWIRTVDPTRNAAFSRLRAVRITVDADTCNSFFEQLYHLCLTEVRRPMASIARTVSEAHAPSNHAMFQEAATRFRIPFSVRYAVNCVLSTGLINASDIGSHFWRTLSNGMTTKDANVTLKCMYDRLLEENIDTTYVNPLGMLLECMTMCNTISALTEDGTADAHTIHSEYHEDRDSDSDSDSDSSMHAEAEIDFLVKQIYRQLKLDGVIHDDTSSTIRNTSPTASTTKSIVRPVESEKQAKQRGYIRRLIQTPTRCISAPPESDLLNRVLREFPMHKDRFLRICFCDEDGGSIAISASNDLLTNVRRTLRKGVHAAGEKFVFLAFSNSQLRDHAAWMYNESETSGSSSDPPTADQIRAWMGDFSKIRIPGKFAARQGQTFSSTVGTVVLDDVQHTIIEDVKDPSGNYTFSDGIGLISTALARKVVGKLPMKNSHSVPSAFQVRFGGVKGILTVWDSAFLTINNVEVAVRPSMVKFESTHKALEIVGYAKRIPFFLNRQIIMLLSGRGVPDAPFLELQNRVLLQLDHAMRGDGAVEALHLLFTSGCGDSGHKLKTNASGMANCANFFRAGLTCVNCEHLFNMMNAFRRQTIRNMKKKARIPIDSGKGVRAIGVMDEIGVLAANQIFCQYTDPESGRNIIVQGSVTVGRSPCLHPGDIQPVHAVDHHALRHLRDVIVFPKVGVRPIPSMLCGGDLDGDIYFCIIDPNINLPQTYPYINVLGGYPPMDYIAPPPDELDHDVTTKEVADFFVSYLRNDRLPQIATAHVVFADKTDLGIESSECLRLAQLHSKAVDFAKTGIRAIFPRDLAFRNNADRYPDFMGKHAAVSYRSRRILGRLYRACDQNQFANDEEYIFRENAQSRDIHDIIESIPEDSEYATRSQQLCHAYNYEMRRIMERFGVKTEGEVVSGQVLSFTERHAYLHGRKEHYTLLTQLNRQVYELRSQFRVIFLEDLHKRGSSNHTPQAIIHACSWYRACRKQAAADDKEQRPTCVSFPWVVDDVLLRVISNEIRR